MKKTSRADLRARMKAQWAKHRLAFWFFFALAVVFSSSLIWTKFMIFEALRQNDVAGAGLEISAETESRQERSIVADEEEYLSLGGAQKNLDDLNFLMSPNGQSIAYTFSDKRFNKKIVSLNGQAGASYDDITFMQFSPNGQRFAYGAKVDGKSFIVLDGQEGKAYDWIFAPRFFTPDNQYFVYKARDSRGDMLVFNQWESRPYDRIYGVTINNSQTQLIFYARKEDKVWRGTVDLDKPIYADVDLQNVQE